MINSVKQKEMEDMLHTLIRSANGWDDLVRFFEENELAKKYYDETLEEMHRDGNYGMSTCMRVALRQAFEDLQDYLDEDETREPGKLEIKIATLELENSKLKEQLYEIKKVLAKGEGIK